jgi:hypothetical protein
MISLVSALHAAPAAAATVASTGVSILCTSATVVIG